MSRRYIVDNENFSEQTTEFESVTDLQAIKSGEKLKESLGKIELAILKLMGLLSSEPETQSMIEDNAMNILAIFVAVSLIQGAAVSGTSDNIFVETFEDDRSIRISSGQYDAENKRIYA